MTTQLASATRAESSRQAQEKKAKRRARMPVLHDGCSIGPEFVYDSEGQPQLYVANQDDTTNGAETVGSGREGDAERQCTTSQCSSTTITSTSPTPVPRPHPHPNSNAPVGRIIWVDFPPDDPANPLCFSRRKKLAIVGVATYFTGITAYSVAAYAIGIPSMCAELGCNRIQAAAGNALYPWGFGIAPLVLAPLSEEFGRRWTYIIAIIVFTLLHLMMTLGKNMGTILVGRFLIGAAGSLGATLVGGTISDIYAPEDRGVPMATFALMAMFFTGLGPITMSWVEARPDLGFRWIQWIEMILTAGYIPLVVIILKETRGPVLIRRRAKKMRKALLRIQAEQGKANEGSMEKPQADVQYEWRYTARSEVGKVKFAAAMRTSLLRPLLFLALEPIVSFFSIWVSLAWGVFYTQVQGLPYIFPRVYGFSTTQTGLIYATMCIGSVIGFALNFVQEAIYRRQKAKHGVEARLYAPMAGGIVLFFGCMIYAFTVQPEIPWIGAAIGITIIIAAVITLYISSFTFLSECYGSYASSALAAMSFLRNMFGGAFSLFTEDMYDTLTPRWAIFMMGMVAGLLCFVPFIAYWKGPAIRARSPFSKLLMAEEKARVAAAEKERADHEADSARQTQWETDVEGQNGQDELYVHEKGNGGRNGYEEVGKWGDAVKQKGSAQLGFERPSSDRLSQLGSDEDKADK